MRGPEIARPGEAGAILALYRAAGKSARRAGCSRWNEYYPDRESIRADLEQGGLYLWREGERLLAAISLVDPMDLQDLDVSWTPARALEACRFCLAPALQGKGLAADFFRAALEAARARGAQAVRLLCARDNPAACRLYTRLGLRRLEDVTWEEIPFHTFEALL